MRKLVGRMRTAKPWLEDSDLPACRAWSELEVLASRIYGEMRDNGFLNEHGQPRTLLDSYRKLRVTQATFANALGMTPLTRIQLRLAKSRDAIDLAALMAKAGTEPEA